MKGKAYKTIEELSKTLESRGVILDIDPVPVLQREGYCALVNGYKGPFLDKREMLAFQGTINTTAHAHPAISGSRIILKIANSMGAIIKTL